MDAAVPQLPPAGLCLQQPVPARCRILLNSSQQSSDSPQVHLRAAEEKCFFLHLAVLFSVRAESEFPGRLLCTLSTFLVLPLCDASPEKRSLPAAWASGRKAIRRSTRWAFQSCSGPETSSCNLREESRQVTQSPRSRRTNLLSQVQVSVQLLQNQG